MRKDDGVYELHYSYRFFFFFLVFLEAFAPLLPAAPPDVSSSSSGSVFSSAWYAASDSAWECPSKSRIGNLKLPKSTFYERISRKWRRPPLPSPSSPPLSSLPS